MKARLIGKHIIYEVFNMNKIVKTTRNLIVMIIFLFLLVLIALTIILTIAERDNLTPVPPQKPIFILPTEYYETLSFDDIMELSNGEAEFIRFGFNNPQIKGVFTTGIILSPQEAVIALTSVRDIFNISSFSYIAERCENHPYTHTYALTQIYNGVEVYGGFRVHASIDGTPLSITGRYIGFDDLNTNPRLSPRQARRKININMSQINETKLIIYEVSENDVRLCWMFTSFDRTVFVDAHTGETVRNSSIIDW